MTTTTGQTPRPKFVALWGEVWRDSDDGNRTMLYALDAEGNAYMTEPSAYSPPRWEPCATPPAAEGSGNA